MKPFFFGVTALLLASNYSISKATLPPIQTLEEKVTSARYIFIGVAEKVKIFKLQPEEFYPQEKTSRQKRLPTPPGPYRLFEFEVHLTEVIKSGKRPLPKMMKLKLQRAFLDEEDMKRDVAEIAAKFSRREQIYLVESLDLFSIENTVLNSQIKTLVKNARMKDTISAHQR